MALIINELTNINSISLSDTNGIIRTSNYNFNIIRRALLKILNDVNYSETNKSMTLSGLTVGNVSVTGDIKINNNNTNVFSINQNGFLYTQNASIEGNTTTNKLRLKYLTSIGDHGNPGDIVYGFNKATGTVDFWGYIDSVGWVSLTEESGGEPIPPITTESLPKTIAGVTTTDDLPYDGKSYIIKDDSENNGKIAVWSAEEKEYIFTDAKDTSYAVSSEKGDIYVYDSASNEWNNVTADKTIGGEEYTDGLHEYTPDTLISETVDDFNKDLKYLYSKSLIAFKNVEGKAHTSNDTSLSDETISGGINIPANNVFSLDISDMISSISNGYVKQITTNLVNIPGTNSYRVNYTDGTLKMISPSFNTGYTVTITNDGSVMTESSYVVQYTAGVVSFDEDLTISNPKITFYNYEGQTLKDAIISANVSLYTGDLDKTITSTTSGNNFKTTLSLTADPKTDSEIMVRVNGLTVSVGDGVKTKDCWFGSATDGSVKGFSNIEKGDILYWNGNIAGYDLDSTDNISFSYLIGKASEENPEPEPTPTPAECVTIQAIADEDIKGGSFVHINTNGTIATATCGSISKSISALFASGFVVDDVKKGEVCDVYLTGLVGTTNKTFDIGDYLYLGLNGTFSNGYDDDYAIIQNIAKSVKTNEILINIEEPIKNENN